MPRDSAGVYTLPAGNPVVDGTIIETTWANPTMADVAVQLNGVITRDGLLGPTQPFLLTDGNNLAPGLAFAADTDLGFYRVSPNTMAFVSGGSVVQGWNTTGTQITGDQTVSGNATIGGTLGVTGAVTISDITGPSTLTGDLSVTGKFGISLGTEALPGLYFNGDPNTGIYSVGADQFNVTTGGVTKIVAVPANVQIRPSAIASAPSLVVGAGTNVVGDGYAIDITGSGVATDYARIRFLNNAYSIERLILATDSAAGYLHTLGALPLVFGTNNTNRLTLAATGEARFQGAFVAAPNFWVAETSAGAGSVGVASGAGASTVYWGSTSAGVGQMDLYASGQKQATIQSPGATANSWVISGGVAGVRVAMSAGGTDANIGMQWTTKGTGDYAYFGNGGVHLQVTTNNVGTTWVQIAGNTGVAPNYPTITSNAAKLTMSVATRFTGALSTAGDLSAPYSQVSAYTHSWIDSTRSPNDKIAELLWTAGGFQARFLNDANTDARSIWVSNGGVASGVLNTLFYTGANDLTMYLHSAGGGGGFGRVGIGSLLPKAQLAVYGLGQADPAGNVFDPDFAAAGGTLYLSDTGATGAAGGCIMFGAFATTGALNGKHFASIKSYITDASANTAGELRFNLKNTSADTGSTQVLRLTANRTIYDSRDLGVGRDIGANLTAPNCPIGSIIIGAVAGLNLNSLSTLNAAATNITMFGCGTGSNTTINIGTWRFIGALSSSSNTGLWIRSA